MEPPIDSPEALHTGGIHAHAFWLYGVIVGFALEEALREVVPHAKDISRSIELGVVLQFIRLALFLCLVVRFYLGSVRFFNLAHVRASAHADYPAKNYTMDFFFGLIHFSAFLALALSIDETHPNSMFLFWLSFILLYDLVWLFGCRKYDTFHLVKLWTFVNVITFVVSIALYFILLAILTQSGVAEVTTHFWCEFACMVPIFIFSMIDIREVLKAEPIFEKWFANLLSSKRP